MMLTLIAWPPAGCYILAVSGGADSMALLDIFAQAVPERSYKLVVAHFDHGLRSDSATDRQFVQEAASRYQLPFEYHEAGLGKGSEAIARAARHAWLRKICQKYKAAALITAHHQDDLLETSLLNLSRGSGRRGLAPMHTGDILRPLLGTTREELRSYLAAHHLMWHEDPTNTDLTNPRNFLRHKLLPHLNQKDRSQYLELITGLAKLNQDINESLQAMLDSARNGQAYIFPRQLIRDLSLTELEELLMAASYRLLPDIELDQRLVQEIALFAKTARPHRQRNLRQDLLVRVEKDYISLKALQLAIKPLI